MTEEEERKMKSDPLYLIIREDRRRAGKNIGPVCMRTAYIFAKSESGKARKENVISESFKGIKK